MGSRSRRGMTLTELVVVIGIIGMLAAIVLPAVKRATVAARRTRLAADLNTISIGLEAYRGDFGDYPRPDNLDSDRYRGAATLCRAMLGPGPMNGTDADGADGFGFRTARASSQLATGRVYGPYLRPEHFKVSWVNGKAPADLIYRCPVILDIDNSPIIYYVARPTMPNIHLPDGYVATAFLAYVGQPLPSPLYNYYDNAGPYPYGESKMRVLLGDLNINGGIEGDEVAATTAPYLLWCAGPDGQFGLVTDPRTLSMQERRDARRDVDDVTTFNFH